MTNNIKKYDNKIHFNPCQDCSLMFMHESFEDCTFCSNFVEACNYHGYKVSDFIPHLKD